MSEMYVTKISPEMPLYILLSPCSQSSGNAILVYGIDFLYVFMYVP